MHLKTNASIIENLKNKTKEKTFQTISLKAYNSQLTTSSNRWHQSYKLRNEIHQTNLKSFHKR